MTIEIKDREAYIKKCENTLRRIRDVQKAEDKEYEQSWRRQWPWRYWRKETDMPPKNFPFYPSVAGWRQSGEVVRMLKALKDPAGTVTYITAEDLEWLD